MGDFWIMGAGGHTHTKTHRQTHRQTHQYHDSAWPRGRAEWKCCHEVTLSIMIFLQNLWNSPMPKLIEQHLWQNDTFEIAWLVQKLWLGMGWALQCVGDSIARVCYRWSFPVKFNMLNRWFCLDCRTVGLFTCIVFPFPLLSLWTSFLFFPLSVYWIALVNI